MKSKWWMTFGFAGSILCTAIYARLAVPGDYSMIWQAWALFDAVACSLIFADSMDDARPERAKVIA